MDEDLQRVLIALASPWAPRVSFWFDKTSGDSAERWFQWWHSFEKLGHPDGPPQGTVIAQKERPRGVWIWRIYVRDDNWTDGWAPVDEVPV